MKQRRGTGFGRAAWAVVITVFLVGPLQAATSDTEHPLEPLDRSSPRATLTSFLDAIERAWELYSTGDPGFEEPLDDARACLDLSEVPPLVLESVSAETALVLKEVLDRIALPPPDEIPGRATVEELGLTRWTVPHTEIQLVQLTEGELEGLWVFSTDTVRRAEGFYSRVQDLPYRPGRSGGHLEELRAGSSAIVLIRLVSAMPSWFKSEIGGMMVWQWFGLATLVVVMALAVLLVAWLGRHWRRSSLPGHRLAGFLVPLAMISTPLAGRFMIDRLFELPGAPAFGVQLVFSIVGYVGLAWLVGVAILRFGDLTVRLWFRDARPLRKQLVRVIFRIATIIVVTIVALKAAQTLGVPVAGLIAGVGVGGLAIALAAQGTLENLIGGIILYADQPVKVGDFCRFGDRLGTVEDVGLRSVKIRTTARTVVTVPNADFAKLQLENLSERDQILLQQKLSVRYETTREQLAQLVSGLEAMLEDHPQIADEPLRVRFTGFGTYCIEIELFCYARTDTWADFLEIRQDVLLKAMEIVERSGTRLALPTQVQYSVVDREQAEEHRKAGS